MVRPRTSTPLGTIPFLRLLLLGSFSIGSAIGQHSTPTDSAHHPTQISTPPQPTEQVLQGEVFGKLVSGQYQVIGSIAVPSGKSLVIEAGATLRFGRGGSLTCRGNLLVRGMAEAPVRFLATVDSPRPGSWTGLVLSDMTHDQIIEHAEIAHAVVGIQSTGGQGCTFRYLSIHDCKDYGIAFYGDSTRSLVTQHALLDSEVSRCGKHGILVRALGSGCVSQFVKPEIRNCRVHDNSGSGIHVISEISRISICGFSTTAECSPSIDSNEVTSNGSNGISVQGDGDASSLLSFSSIAPSIVNNVVQHNSENGVWLGYNEFTRVAATIVNNTILKNQGMGIEHAAFDRSFLVANNILSRNRRANWSGFMLTSIPLDCVSTPD